MSKPIEVQLMEVLDEYQDSLRDKIHGDFEEIGKETSEDLRNVSKNTFKTHAKSRKYWRGWTYKMQGEGLDTRVTIYNRNAPGLTHLLENGHQVYAWGKNRGRYNGVKHIEPAEKEATERLLRKLTNDL